MNSRTTKQIFFFSALSCRKPLVPRYDYIGICRNIYMIAILHQMEPAGLVGLEGTGDYLFFFLLGGVGKGWVLGIGLHFSIVKPFKK